MNLPIKLLGSLAVAGMVAAGGTAFTASGLTGPAITTQAVGVGSAIQSVTGAAISTVHYNATEEDIDSIELVFAAPLQLGSTVGLGVYSDAGSTPIGAASVDCVNNVGSNRLNYLCTITASDGVVTSSTLKQITVTVA